MTILNLDALMRPRSVALVGPNRLEPDRLALVADRLAPCGTARWAIGLGADCPGFDAATLGDPGVAPDLAVYLGGPDHAVETVAALAEAGTRAVVALSVGYDAWPDDVLRRALEAGRSRGLRLVGPGSIGVRVPGAGLDASLMVHAGRPGDLALVARSGAIVNATLAWAARHGVGFSGVVSLGQKADVDVGDLLDWFATDGRTRAILIHMETISDPRKFMSAARAAARTKPVVVLRSGLTRDLPRAIDSLCSRLAPTDRVYDAAFARAGLVRVFDIDEVFEAAETVSRFKAPAGGRLGVIANGRSLASMAADRLAASGGKLAHFGETTTAVLEPLVRSGTWPANPVILQDDADPTALAETLAALLSDREVDGVLAAAAPTSVAPVAPLVDVLIAAATEHRKRALRRKPILAVLLDLEPEEERRLSEAGILVRQSPGAAIRSFQHLVNYGRGQEELASTPPEGPPMEAPLLDEARSIIEAALDEGRSQLGQAESRRLLRAFGIETLERTLATTPEEARIAAAALLAGAPRCRIGPAYDDATTARPIAVEVASAAGAERLASFLLSGGASSAGGPVPEAVALEPALPAADTIALAAGIVDDPAFGPAVVLAHAGALATAAPVSVELPPLDLKLAAGMVDRLGLDGLEPGEADREEGAGDRGALLLALARVGQLAARFPEVRAIDVAQLLVGGGHVRAADVTVHVAPVGPVAGRLGHPRLAIRPYPNEWQRDLTLRDGRRLEVHPIRPEDEPAYKAFLESIDPEDLRLRFFAPLRHIGHAMLARLTQLDYARAMAFVAKDPRTGAIQGSVRLHADPDHRIGEYAILLRSELKGQGLGWALMSLIIEYARADGLQEIVGEVLRENTTMLALCTALGFEVKPVPDDEGLVEVHLPVAQTDIRFHDDLGQLHASS
ncbi:bifunctional acetate--CoA ligase family protein/GNAT family N-acetyltransferase [Amorphus coralli]|uniref:bifunctional acetate--CoA ligase family protein/GNAT family N-acetyltransferase n=1 Tax=Amorphus coralli TaxID=340680 RepID=UPI000381ED22|nr:GNAT family N-acetyltransferase [Amorphus coralli]